MFWASDDDGAARRGTIMTIRVKKSDADAFAKGKMNLEDFRKKARITTYAGGFGGDGFFSFNLGGGGFGSGFNFSR